MGETVPLLCRPGLRQRFGIKGNSHQGFGAGWSAPEPHYIWNDGPEAELIVALDGAVTPMQLTLEGMPFVTARVPAQVLELYVNGHHAGFVRLRDSDGIRLRCDIEPEWWVMRDGVAVLKLLFHLPDSARPADLGEGADRRALAFCFLSLQLDPAVEG